MDWDDILNTDYSNMPIYIHRMDDIVKHYFEKDFKLKLKGYSIRMED